MSIFKNRLLISLLVAIALVLVWTALIALFNVPSYIAPTPAAVVRAFLTGLQTNIYGPNLAATLHAMVVGYLLGVVSGIAFGAILAEFPAVEGVAFPYLVSIQAIPKIALAPLFVLWFGYGIVSKLVMVSLICFFPMVVSTMVGLRSTERDRIDIVKTMTATRFQIFWHVKLPSAAHSIFAGLQVSVVLALMRALVGEFVGSDMGLGNLIQASQASMDSAGMFAVLAILSVIGIVFTAGVRWIQKKIVFWGGQRGTADSR